MKVIVLGATGMVGQGVLRECLLSSDVERVLLLGRNASGATHDKLTEIVHADLFDLSSIESDLAGYDACFDCLGPSSAGMTEEAYRHITYDMTLAIARTFAKMNPEMTFIYVSGVGTDSTEKGRAMWARVKGATENALLALPFKAAYMFRPGFIRPLHGITSRTPLYRVLMTILWPLFPIAMWLFPKQTLSTESIGLAMLAVAKNGAPKKVLEPPDINATLV